MPRVPEPLRWRALPGVLALVALAYANSFAGIPQYDDWNVIVDSPAVASLAAWRESMPGIRPLLKLSYALNNSLGGLAGFHALNLLLHGLNVAMVLALLGRLLPGRRPRRWRVPCCSDCTRSTPRRSRCSPGAPCR